MLYAAFILGLLGSLHCVVMCGPITLVLSNSTIRLARYLVGRALYNGGRILTYTALGAGLGLSKDVFGTMLFDIHGAQEVMSLAIGSAMLAGLVGSLLVQFSASKVRAHSLATAWFRASGHLVLFLRRQMGAWLRSTSYGGQMILGVVNGFLPCGFVYMALALASLSGSTLEAATSMAVFGLGTVPAMFLTAVIGRVLQSHCLPQWVQLTMWSSCVRALLRRAAPIAVGVIAVLFIVRGLALDIPYLSPKLNPKVAGVERGCHLPAKQSPGK
jgi:sulfite exporter TauE/SafE